VNVLEMHDGVHVFESALRFIEQHYATGSESETTEEKAET